MLKEGLENQILRLGESRLLDLITTPFLVDNRHLWGYEIHVVNEPEYCCKFLVLTSTEYKSSVHYHKKKKETFTLISGRVNLTVGRHVEILSTLGDKITIPIMVRHSFWAFGGPAVILEISTHDDPEDNYKLVPSQKI